MYNYRKIAKVISLICLALALSIYVSRKARLNKYLIKDISEQAPLSYKIQVNDANIYELSNLEGIGPGLAQTIIDYRNHHGNFEQINDLLKVKGIGEKKYLKIKDYITVKH